MFFAMYIGRNHAEVQRTSRINRLNRISECFLRAIVTEEQGAKKGFNQFVDTLLGRDNGLDTNRHLVIVTLTELLSQRGVVIERQSAKISTPVMIWR